MTITGSAVDDSGRGPYVGCCHRCGSVVAAGMRNGQKYGKARYGPGDGWFEEAAQRRGMRPGSLTIPTSAVVTTKEPGGPDIGLLAQRNPRWVDPWHRDIEVVRRRLGRNPFRRPVIISLEVVCPPAGAILYGGRCRVCHSMTCAVCIMKWIRTERPACAYSVRRGVDPRVAVLDENDRLPGCPVCNRPYRTVDAV
jgi:hypothetical protein